MYSSWWLWLLLVAACGRLGFEEAVAKRDAGRSTACAGRFDLCDDFESGMSAYWTTIGAVAVDSTRAHRGVASVHVSTPALAAHTVGRAKLEQSTSLADGPRPFWLRAWLFVHGAPAPGNRVELFAAEQTRGAKGDYLFEHADHVSLYSQFGDAQTEASQIIPEGTWTCIVWHVVPRATSGTMTMSGDLGTLTLDASTDDTAMPILPISIGLDFETPNVTASQPAIDLWIDDVIVHHDVVTCAD